MRGVTEWHPDLKTKDLPPVRIIIVEGDEDLTIKISDEGGGIKRTGIPYIWTYLYTTAKPPENIDDSNGPSESVPPLAGFGYGLPIARLYARYLGGDLNIVSLEGFGTDAFVHLKRLAHESSEALPFHVKRD